MLNILKYLNNRENIILSLEEIEYLKLFIKLNIIPDKELEISLKNLGELYNNVE